MVDPRADRGERAARSAEDPAGRRCPRRTVELARGHETLLTVAGTGRASTSPLVLLGVRGIGKTVALGLLRDDAERVMRKNFPNSVYYTRGLDREVPWWKLW